MINEVYSKENAFQDQESIQAPLGLWRHLFGGQRALLHVFTGVRQGDKLTKAKWANFTYPQAAEAAARWALEKSEEGREAYFCGHLLEAPRRIKKNAASVRALYGELDGAAPPNGEYKPTALVESSPGRFHVYWRLTDAIPPAAAEKLNKALAREIGADASGFDLTQLLRVPETTNFKYPERPTVRLVELNGSREYAARDLEERLQPEPEPDAPKTEDDSEAHEPPVRLGAAGLRRWRGEVVERDEDGELDRSLSLVQIARMLASASATKRTVVEALRDRDVALGWNKYATRKDGGKKAYGDLADDVCGPFESSEGAREDEDEHQASSSSKKPRDSRDYEEVSGLVVERMKDLPRYTGKRPSVIEDIFPEGFPTSLYGEGGIMKSMIALHMLLHISSGRERWCRFPVSGQRACLFIDFELDRWEQGTRSGKLAAGMGLEEVPYDLHYLWASGYDSRRVFALAQREVKQHRIGVVCVDSVGLALQGDSIAGADVIEFFRTRCDAFKRLGTAVLLVDHQSGLLPGQSYQQKRQYGSVYKGYLSRSRLQLQKDPAEGTRVDGMRVIVRQNKSNFSPQRPFKVEVTFEEDKTILKRVELEEEELRTENSMNATDRILLALLDGSAYPGDLTEKTGIASTRNVLSKLRKEDLIEETEKVAETGGRRAAQVRLTSEGRARAKKILDRTF